jgi:ParB family chromosome partitioning protein
VPTGLGAPELATLLRRREAGGAPIGAYRDPLCAHPLLVAVLPLDALEPTPFQRDLSPTHVKRLAQKIDEAGAFLDPVIVVRGATGGFWTPNGRHRLAAAKLLGMRAITALVSADEALAFKILALNTERRTTPGPQPGSDSHGAGAGARPRARGDEFENEFELAPYLTARPLLPEGAALRGRACRSCARWTASATRRWSCRCASARATRPACSRSISS